MDDVWTDSLHSCAPFGRLVCYLSYFSSIFSNSLVEFSFSSINFWLAYSALSSFSFRISTSVYALSFSIWGRKKIHGNTVRLIANKFYNKYQ